MPAFADLLEHLLDRGDGGIPLARLHLLRADMERDAVRLEPELARLDQQVGRHLGRAAELAVQRPQGAFAVDQDAAEHLRARRGSGDLFQLRLAVEGVELHTAGVRPGDVGLLLDGVAEGDPLRRDAEREHLGDLARRGGVEAGALVGQAGQDFLRRVGLHGIEHFSQRQGAGQRAILLRHHVQVDHQARGSGTSLVQELLDFVVHFLRFLRGRHPERP